MTISVIGTGYVGLVSGACLAELGLDVLCVDKDETKISRLKKGIIPIYEPGLEEIVIKNFKQGRLSFTNNIEEAITSSKVIFIAVGTPTNENDGSADLSAVFGVAEEISDFLNPDSVIVIKSTVPVSTGKRFREIVQKKNKNLRFHMVSNPEFLREGCAVKDFLHPERIIIGTESDKGAKAMKLIYKEFANQNIPILYTDIATAELTKYAANAFLATKIAFINEIADICEKTGANVEAVAEGMGHDHRIGKDYLKPGPGFGGSCFPKDTLALRKISYDLEAPSQIVESTIASNEKRKTDMAKKVINAMGGNVKSSTIAVLGLAFKANTDDMRDSSSINIIKDLLKAGAKIKAYDPQSMNEAKKIFKGKISWGKDEYDAIKGADSVVIVTEWNEFKALDFEKAKKLVKQPLIIDLRNLFNPDDLRKAGFGYISLGRKPIIQLLKTKKNKRA